MTRIDCSALLEEYSDYRDGVMDPERAAEIDAHLVGCDSCGRYHRVIEGGVNTLRAGSVRPSEDFLDRLQHRLHHLQDGPMGRDLYTGSGARLALILLLAGLFVAAAWVPTTSRSPARVEFSPVTAAAPNLHDVVPALFRTGPLLGPVSRSSLGSAPDPSLLFRYTPLGSSSGSSSLETGSRR